MSEKDKDASVDRLFEGLAPPGPGPALRARVLAAARAGTIAEPIGDVWTRIWNNRWLRMAWATSVVALLVGHVALVPPRPSSPMVMAEAHPDEELTELLQLLRIERAAYPHLGRRGGGGHAFVELDDGGNPL